MDNFEGLSDVTWAGSKYIRKNDSLGIWSRTRLEILRRSENWSPTVANPALRELVRTYIIIPLS